MANELTDLKEIVSSAGMLACRFQSFWFHEEAPKAHLHMKFPQI